MLKDKEVREAIGMVHIAEIIFSHKDVIIPLADVQHIEKHYHNSDLIGGIKKGDFSGCQVITKHTKWAEKIDTWENAIWLNVNIADAFIRAWCLYRQRKGE